MAAYVLSRVLGLAREMVISHQFGTSRDLDAYRAAFNIPDLIFTLIAGGALGSAFIPTFTTYLARGERDEAWRLASAVMNLAFLGLDGLGDRSSASSPPTWCRWSSPASSATRPQWPSPWTWCASC